MHIIWYTIRGSHALKLERNGGSTVAKKYKPETIADQLKKAIRESGLTSYALGKAADVGQPVIDRFLSGERDIRMATAAKLAFSLGCELSIPDELELLKYPTGKIIATKCERIVHTKCERIR